MALKFRLKGLAETFIETITCPCCGVIGNDDQYFTTELTKVTFEGIIVVVQCRSCSEIFVPDTQRLGVLNPEDLKLAVEKDSVDTGEAVMPSYKSVKLNAEKLNAVRKGALH
jgi:C4-type Zn-finger protein